MNSLVILVNSSFLGAAALDAAYQNRFEDVQ